jgi:hypothetical protein
LPSWVKAMERTPPGWALMVLALEPSVMFQSLMVPSWLAEARTVESPRKQASVTASLCPAQL